jgi:hypothetical protein
MSASDLQPITFAEETVLARRQRRIYRLALWQLWVFGMLLELAALAFCTWLVRHTATNTALWVAWSGTFPWLIQGYTWLIDGWTFIGRVVVPDGLHAYALAVVLGAFLVFWLLLLLVMQGVGRVEMPRATGRSIFVVLLVWTILLSLTMLIVPVELNALSRDMFLSGLYGRMVDQYHLNPYVVEPRTLSHDRIEQMLASLPQLPPVTFGPVWIDLCILVSLAAHSDLVRMLVGFRLLGLLAHLGNVILLWSMLGRLTLGRRVAATLAYAWNPLVLSLGITFAHQDVILAFFVLLSLLNLRHEATLLGWLFALLAAVVNFLGLLLLPLCFILLVRLSRTLSPVGRFFWWLGWFCISALVIGIAYAPYWQGSAPAALLVETLHFFWPATALNSLEAALLSLPNNIAGVFTGLFSPHVWMILLLICIVVVTLFSLGAVNTFTRLALSGYWVVMLLVLLQPVYWPWLLFLPLVLALCTGDSIAILCVLFLQVGAAITYYLWLQSIDWPQQGLLTIGLPFIIWGWLALLIVFFQMVRAERNSRRRRTTERQSIQLLQP